MALEWKAEQPTEEGWYWVLLEQDGKTWKESVYVSFTDLGIYHNLLYKGYNFIEWAKSHEATE